MGLLLTFVIVGAWGGHLMYTLNFVELDLLNPLMYIHILIQSWLFTGLFITGHDAMHGTVTRVRWLNNIIGYFVTLLYAGMWYPVLIKKHQLHHIYPGTAKDPDFCVKSQHFFVWWFSFMKAYLTIGQLVFMAVLFNIGLLFFNEVQLIVLWVIPAFVSTFQLFYFGTYLPHRLPHTDAMQPYNSRTLPKNHLWAMVSCYFFGYHYEHHQSPYTPWWRLKNLK